MKSNKVFVILVKLQKRFFARFTLTGIFVRKINCNLL